ncbi:3468_t:CDS:2 [Funneliformis caledonium]|uniref:3468_t:CDS:1 n=1 Tax=Funneliformis caledonium TaxID=1117310 RepID=A0A9N9BWT4_9GLOM|nr:3468_t:CDS:2 [Funneliformis caledonium]
MIITLTTGERSYTMATYFNTQSDEKAMHLQAIVHDSKKFNWSDDLLKNVRFIYQRLEIIIKRRRQEIENTSLEKPQMIC